MPQHKTICVLTDTLDEIELMFRENKDESWSDVFNNALKHLKGHLELESWLRTVLLLVRKEVDGKILYDAELLRDFVEKLRSTLGQ